MPPCNAAYRRPVCYGETSLPKTPLPGYVPDPDDCRNVVKQLREEKDAMRIRKITSISREVPHGGYLYPHYWSFRTCMIYIGFRSHECSDYSSLRNLADQADVIARACLADSRVWGGKSAAGLGARLLVSLQGNVAEAGRGDVTNGTLRNTNSTADPNNIQYAERANRVKSA